MTNPEIAAERRIKSATSRLKGTLERLSLHPTPSLAEEALFVFIETVSGDFSVRKLFNDACTSPRLEAAMKKHSNPGKAE